MSIEKYGVLPPEVKKKEYQETEIFWSLRGDHVYSNSALKTTEEIDTAIVHLLIDGALERIRRVRK